MARLEVVRALGRQQHAHDSSMPHGWDSFYLRRFGRFVCACGHELRFHNHNGGKIPCVACDCDYFLSPEDD